MKLSVPVESGGPRRLAGSVAEWRTRGRVEVLTVQDVAAYLELPISTVYRLACRGDCAPGRGEAPLADEPDGQS
jgi:Helix-turn-helix domain